ncbi:MAG: hypothetical protein FWE21_08065 [Defluviitaleaceae bacterium]|nr:hypothetical protein [Defluviitaleaceae bacterium]
MVKLAFISALALLGICLTQDICHKYITKINEVAAYSIRYDAGWDEIKHIFTRDTDAVVRDLKTGHTFAIRRTFGRYHADIEPLTKEDAATMYEIWGGWCWSRRPVAVYVGGYVFAGSLTNFPHAGRDDAPANVVVYGRSGGFGRGVNLDAVKGNGVDGHMCLHFAGSRIHGSGRINHDHQQAVERARQILQGK